MDTAELGALLSAKFHLLRLGKKTDKKTAVKSVGQYFHFESVFYPLLQGYFHLDNQCQSPSQNLEDHPCTSGCLRDVQIFKNLDLLVDSNTFHCIPKKSTRSRGHVLEVLRFILHSGIMCSPGLSVQNLIRNLPPDH